MWKTFSFVKNGLMHEKNNILGQDKISSFEQEDYKIFSISDGAGSKSLSGLGAEIISREAVNYLKDNFEKTYNTEDSKEIKKEIIDYLYKKLLEESERNDCDIKELSATLILAALKDNRFITLNLGDGIIFIKQNNKISPISFPDKNEKFNETYFLTSPDSYRKLQAFKGTLDEIEGFLFCSDGLGNVFYNRKTKRIPFIVNELIKRSQITNKNAMKVLMEEVYESTLKKITFDDLSMVILSRHSLNNPNVYEMDKKSFIKDYLEYKRIPNRSKIKKIYLILHKMERGISFKDLIKTTHMRNSALRNLLQKMEKAGILIRKNNKFFIY